MPVCAAWMDELRAAFGKESVDGWIKDGIAGEGEFFAREAGYEIGYLQPEPDPARTVTADEILEAKAQWSESKQIRGK